MEIDEVILEIEGTPIKCSKKDLIENSDYFKAMFEGNFLERNKSNIKLQGIDLKSMNIILTLLWDDTYIINNTDILIVLQTACMLQFERIRENCIGNLTEMLSPDNCVRIWLMTELLDLKPLYYKAKNMALMEFDVIKETDCLLELNLKQLHQYLANSLLQNDEELDVFNVCMRWYYEQNKQDLMLESLLRCVDFTRLKDADIKEIMMFPDVRDNTFLINVLNCVIDSRNCTDVEKYTETVLSEARILYECRSRVNYIPVDPMFFVKNLEGGQNAQDYYFDSYKRKRKYIRLDDLVINAKIGQAAAILKFDKKTCDFMHCLEISEEKFTGHEGFHVVGYKEQIFLFGGEVMLGSGNWNMNFWVYDTIRSRWERKTRLPVGRRHFQSCVCGHYLYVIGGTGSFRIIQDNMFWYNYKSNVWSKQIMLPCAVIHLKCCNYKNKLFLLHISNRCGYFSSPGDPRFITFNISDADNLVPKYPDRFTLFAFGNSIFIKGSTLIELKVTANSLNVIKSLYLGPINCDTMESIICKDTVYTLYKYNESKTITVEILSMKTYEVTYLCQNVSEDDPTALCDGKFLFGMSTKLFALQHHSRMAEKDVYINNL